MNINKIACAIAMASTLVAGSSFAADQGHGTVKFTGTVNDSPCTITGDSIDQSVPLGSISAATLANGGTSVTTPFSIKLADCALGTKTSVKVTFNGTAGDSKDGLDKAFSVTGTAKNIGVVIQTASGELVKPNDTGSEQAISDGSNSLDYVAFVQGGTASAVVNGDFESVAKFTLAYP